MMMYQATGQNMSVKITVLDKIKAYKGTVQYNLATKGSCTFKLTRGSKRTMADRSLATIGRTEAFLEEGQTFKIETKVILTKKKQQFEYIYEESVATFVTKKGAICRYKTDYVDLEIEGAARR